MDVILVVIDSFGIGALPDADLYNDAGANTALHICENIPGDKWPFLAKLGLGNASELLGNALPGCPSFPGPASDYGVMAEKSPGKDTTTGHWELAGIVLDKPFTTFPPACPSFPPGLTDAFVREAAPGFLGNCAASGTEIITRLGEQHMRTGYPIIYTSSDSVLQIASHEDIIPVEKLYEMCRAARKLCDPYMVGRVIARPFTGSPEKGFTRTEGRHDFSIQLPGKTLLDNLSARGVKTIGVGKIGDIFNLQGLDKSYPVKGNAKCLEQLFSLLSEKKDYASCTSAPSLSDGCEDAAAARENRFIFVNLVDTDMNFGHRRDIKGYCDAVAAVDSGLEKAADLMRKGDVLIITADHGCDPSFPGTDHTREYVPLLVYTKREEMPEGASGRTAASDAAIAASRHICGSSLGIKESFSFASSLVYDLFNIDSV